MPKGWGCEPSSALCWLQRWVPPPGSVVLSNRFGDGPFHDCERFVRVVLPQGIEIEGVYSAPRGVQPERYWLY